VSCASDIPQVLINAKGDLIVRPSFIETALLRRPGGVAAHHLASFCARADDMLAASSCFAHTWYNQARRQLARLQIRNYQRSLAAVICAQLHGKRLRGGLKANPQQ
jgi:hypothetical protein